MKSFGVLSFVLLSGLCLADEKIDNHMDNFLNTTFASEVRSLEIGKEIATNFSVEFQEEVSIGILKGKADFKDGEVRGLDKAQRKSKCESKREGTSISCDILLDMLKVEYDGKVKFGNLINKDIKAEAEISNTTFTVEIKTGEKPVVQKFSLTEKNNATGSISGLEILTKFFKKVRVGFVKQVEDIIFEDLTPKLQDAMNRALANDTSTALWLRKMEDE